MWNATGPRWWHDQLSFVLVSEAHEGVHALFWGPILFKEANDTANNCSAERAAAITRLIAEFVARDLCLLSIVCGDGFRQLLNTIEPGYQVPSHNHITTVCRQIFQTKKELREIIV